MWEFEAYSGQMQDAMRLRHDLLPTLYSGLARMRVAEGGGAPGTGQPMPVRALYIDYAEEEDAYGFADRQFLYGPLVVAPVTKPVLGKDAQWRKPVWVPPGRWCWFGATAPAVPAASAAACALQGPATVQVPPDTLQSPSAIPALAPLPTIMAMQDNRTAAAAPRSGVLRWAVLGAAAGAREGASAASCFEDDGVSPAAGSQDQGSGNTTTTADLRLLGPTSARVTLSGQAPRRQDVELWSAGGAVTPSTAVTLNGQAVPRASSGASAPIPSWFLAHKGHASRPAATVVVQLQAADGVVEIVW